MITHQILRPRIITGSTLLSGPEQGAISQRHHCNQHNQVQLMAHYFLHYKTDTENTLERSQCLDIITAVKNSKVHH